MNTSRKSLTSHAPSARQFSLNAQSNESSSSVSCVQSFLRPIERFRPCACHQPTDPDEISREDSRNIIGSVNEDKSPVTGKMPKRTAAYTPVLQSKRFVAHDLGTRRWHTAVEVRVKPSRQFRLRWSPPEFYVPARPATCCILSVPPQ